jgi:cell division protein FtsL
MSRGIFSLARKVRPAWWVLILCVATAGVWQRFEVMSIAREIEQTQVRITDLKRMRDRLLADCSMLSSRERIESFARNELGMIPTTRSQKRVLYVDTAGEAIATSEGQR